jgi:hypothetical protein
MRTTLDIDDDVLHAAKERARRERKTAGQVISELARMSLTGGAATIVSKGKQVPAARFGFRPFPHRGGIVTNELIDSLRDEDAY